MPVVHDFLRILVGIVYAVSGYQKLLQPQENFMAVLDAYSLFPSDILIPLSFVIPWIEFLLGVFLVVGLWRTFNLAVLATLCFSFVLVLAQVKIRNLPLNECGCFGDLVAMSPSMMIVVDVLTLTMALFLIKFLPAKSPLSLDKFFINK